MVSIKGIEYKANKNEVKEAARIAMFVTVDAEYAQRSADIWMRSAPDDKAATRRKAIVKAMGLSDVVTFS